MNLTLIGMAGAGKSYLGKKLAGELGFGWQDSDVELSRQFGGKDIQSILEELGEEKYLATEAALSISQTTGKDKLVISPAGSVAYVPEWMRHLRDISKVVYLKIPFETVETRLLKVPPRAIIGLGKKSLRELYEERHPLYEKAAHLVVEPEKLSSDQLVQAIMQLLGVDKKPSAARM